MGIFGWLPQRGPKPATPDDAPEQSLAVYASQPALTAVIVTLIGIEAEQIDEIIDVTARRFGKQHKIVYLTDSLDFMRFRDRNAIFEYMPSALEQKLHAAMAEPSADDTGLDSVLQDIETLLGKVR